MAGIILIRGGGDLASGVALRLHRAGLSVVITELEKPLAVRRSVSFAEAIYAGKASVEGLEGRSVESPGDMLKVLGILAKHQIPVIVDPDCRAAETLHPVAIVDARMKKSPPERLSHRALIYVGLGPGFVAPRDCHAVIETERGHTLGRVIWDGAALEDSGTPHGDSRRILRAPASGILESDASIGNHLEAGQTIAMIGEHKIVAPFIGILRGLLHPGTAAVEGMKIGDIDSREDPQLCELASDKSLAVGGGVLEALVSRPEVRAKLWS